MDRLASSIANLTGGHKALPPPAPTSFSPRGVHVMNSPNNTFALANVAAVNAQDFPDNSYVTVDNFFAFTTRVSPDIPPGYIGFNGNQRTWGGWSLNQECIVQGSGDVVSYIGTLEIELSFRSKNKATDTPFDQDELAKQMLNQFQNSMFSPTQMFLFEFKGHIFDARVKGMQVSKIHEEGDGTISTGIETKGVLLKTTQINFYKGRDGLVNLKSSNSLRPRSDAIIRQDFKFEDMGVGGLDKEFSQIFRRAFSTRMYPPETIQKYNIKHVKGLLLYGPPGTGKTLIARQIGTMLNAREPKIVNGPEMLSKFVGASEENIRKLFKDAEDEYRAKGDDSALHIIIFDELDAVFKQRGARGDSTGVGDNVVNQLLAKMDGVEQLHNILVIGMTNRKDLIDSALLRPGRFEVQVEIKLPDEPGRLQILEIQTKKMRENKLLAADVNLHELAALTKNYSGAELQGLITDATSFALNTNLNIGSGKVTKNDGKDVVLCRAHFMHALAEIQPAFGVSEEDLKTYIDNGIIKYAPRIDEILKNGMRYVSQVQSSNNTRLISLLMHGSPGSGTSALAASIALQSQFPFIKMISSNDLTGMSEVAKVAYMDNTFRDAYKSPLNVLLIDSIETLIEYVPIGPRFSNSILQTLKVFLKRKPPQDRRLLIICTTSSYSVLQQLDMLNCFDNEIGVPCLTSTDEFANVLEATKFQTPEERQQVLAHLPERMNIGIKRALTNIDSATHDDNPAYELIDLMSQHNLRG